MTPQPRNDDLDQYEAWAHDRLTPLLGPLRRTDRRGGRPGLHDFEADLPDGSIAALEVTGEVDAQRLDLASAVGRRLSSIILPDSEFFWLVGLAADARVNAITPEKLRRLLSDLEASGWRNAYNNGDYHDPFVARLRALMVESIHALQAKAGSEGTVTVQAGTYGGWDGTGQPLIGGLPSSWPPPRASTRCASLPAPTLLSDTWSSCSIPSARQAWVSHWR